jgi:hypothetical protein
MGGNTRIRRMTIACLRLTHAEPADLDLAGHAGSAVPRTEPDQRDPGSVHHLLRDRRSKSGWQSPIAGRAVAGVIDGQPPVGTETDQDEPSRKQLLREIGYKL